MMALFNSVRGWIEENINDLIFLLVILGLGCYGCVMIIEAMFLYRRKEVKKNEE
jgi:hypothetical protein